MAYPGERAIMDADYAVGPGNGSDLIFDGFIATCATNCAGANGLGFEGVRFERALNITVRNVEVTNHRWGVTAQNDFAVNNIIIEKSVIHDNADEHGIYFRGANAIHRNVTVRQNLIYRNRRWGFQNNGGADGYIFEENIIHSNALGGITFTNGVHNSIVRNNLFFNNNKQGFLLFTDNQPMPNRKTNDNNLIINNTFWLGRFWNNVCDTQWNPANCAQTQGPSSFSAIEVTDWTGQITHSNNVFRNNTFANFGAPVLKFVELRHLPTTIIENNVFFRADNAEPSGMISTETNGSHTGTAGTSFTWTFSGMQTAWPNIRNNRLGNPLFTDVII